MDNSEKNIFKNMGLKEKLATPVLQLVLPLVLAHSLKKKRKPNFNDGMKGSYLGPNYKLNEIENCLKKPRENF